MNRRGFGAWRAVPRVHRRSRGLSMVVVQYATEALTTHDAAAHGGVVVRGDDELVVETLMIAQLRRRTFWS
jgi:hypothetical protein